MLHSFTLDFCPLHYRPLFLQFGVLLVFFFASHIYKPKSIPCTSKSVEILPTREIFPGIPTDVKYNVIYILNKIQLTVEKVVYILRCNNSCEVPENP